MSNAAKNIMLRVIRRRMAEGEELEDILAGYPKLTDAEKEELREAYFISSRKGQVSGLDIYTK